MKVKAGDLIEFLGCSWDAQWEFDAPMILYSPVKRYGFDGSIPHGVLNLVENVCIDLACGDDEPEDWCASDLKEFAWRGWDKDGFARRTKAHHVRAVVRFLADDKGELSFRYEVCDGAVGPRWRLEAD